ncbi:MAG TPA: hypothetical protein VHQ24_14855, partial [Lachnospiraceae bacterium]|nr:hypothetical protein [Lachnospiraceae bacterium]
MIKIIIVILLFATWSLIIKYHTNKSQKMNDDKMDAFWETERKANSIRKKDISSLSYIHVSLSDLPMNNTSDSQLMQY